MLRLETIESTTFDLLKRMQALPVLSETRLVGGTALALQLGHRVSVDLDVFGKWNYASDLQSELSKVGRVEKESGTPSGRMAGRRQTYPLKIAAGTSPASRATRYAISR